MRANPLPSKRRILAKAIGLKRQVTMARQELHARIWVTSMEPHRAAIVYSRHEDTVVSNECSHRSPPLQKNLEYIF